MTNSSNISENYTIYTEHMERLYQIFDILETEGVSFTEQICLTTDCTTIKIYRHKVMIGDLVYNPHRCEWIANSIRESIKTYGYLEPFSALKNVLEHG